MNTPSSNPLRLVLELTSTLVLIGVLTMLGWRAATAGWTGLPDTLVSMALLGVIFEFCGAFADLISSQGLDGGAEKRVLAFVLSLVTTACIGIPGLLALQRWGYSPTWLAVVFMVPRLVSYVLMPPGNELERRRMVALAFDRWDSLFLALVLFPAAIAASVWCIVRDNGGTPSTLLTVLCGWIIVWMLFVVIATIHDHSAAFARYPLRLYARRPWTIFTLFWINGNRERLREEEKRIREEVESAREWQGQNLKGLTNGGNGSGTASNGRAIERGRE